MRILLIGGNGFIGQPLARELRDANHEVAIFHRSSGLKRGIEEFRSIQGDRNHLSEYRDRIRDFAPDVIVDVILSSGKQAQELMNTASGISPRAVAVSSMDVYRAWGVLVGVEAGALEQMPLTEDSPLRAVRTLYPPKALKNMQSKLGWLNEHYDKIAVEEAVMSSAEVAGTVVRLPMVYGPGDMFHRFSSVVKRVMDGRRSIILPNDYANWRGPRGFVDNVAHAIAMAATSERAAGRIYHVVEEPSLSELAWQTKIAYAMKWPGKIVVLPREQTPKHLLFPGNAAQHLDASSERIRTELRYAEIVSPGEAILRTIAWEEQNPPASLDPQQFDYAAEDSALASAA